MVLKNTWHPSDTFPPAEANDVATQVNTNTADIVTARGVADDAQAAGATALAAAGVADGKAVAALANAATAQSTANGKYTKPGGGIPATDMASAVVTSLGKADTAITVGQTNINADNFSSVQNAINSATGLTRIWLTKPLYTEGGIALPDHTALEGVGGVTIKAPNGLNGAVIINAGAAGAGNTGLELRNLTIDGNLTNQAGNAATERALADYTSVNGDGSNDGVSFGVYLEKVDNWKLIDVEVHHVDGKGAYIIGSYDGSNNPQHVRGVMRGFYGHDNALDGFHIGRGMRRIMISDSRCEYNLRDGAWLDMSESHVEGLNTYMNTRDGIYIRNVAASHMWNMVANRNGRVGIRTRAMVTCHGGAWSAHSNGQKRDTITWTTPIADVFFDDTAYTGYGVTSNSQVHGIQVGPPSNVLHWVEGQEVFATPMEDYGLYVADGVTGDNLITGLGEGYGSPRITYFRFPMAPGNLVALGKTAGQARLQVFTGEVVANAVTTGFRTQATAGGTTTLVYSDAQTQEFTGTLGQTCVLATTKILAGKPVTIHNKSTGNIVVQASNGDVILGLTTGQSATFTARINTPVTGANWEFQYTPNVAPDTGVSNGSLAQRTGAGNVLANAFSANFRSQATTGGTLTLTNGDAQTQEFTGTLTEIVQLATTNIAAGRSQIIINSSSALVTVQSSGGNTIGVPLAPGETVAFTARVATPAAATDWSSSQGIGINANDLTTGESTLSRLMVSSTAVGGASGFLKLTYFTAKKTETVTQVRTVTGGVAASGATLCRVGIFSIDASGNLTLIASTPNDATLWAATFTAYTKSFSASWSKVRGTRYAIGRLFVGTTGPQFNGVASDPTAEAGVAPRICGHITGQSDLPSTATAGSVADTGTYDYVVLLP